MPNGTAKEKPARVGGIVPLGLVQGGGLAGLTGAEAKVLLGLAAYSHRATGEAWPSVVTLTEKLKLTRRAVQRSLRGLERRGIIELVSGGGGRGVSTRYRIRNSAPACAESGPERAQSGAQTAQSGAQTAHGGAPEHIEQEEHPPNPPRGAPPNAPAAAGVVGELRGEERPDAEAELADQLAARFANGEALSAGKARSLAHELIARHGEADARAVVAEALRTIPAETGPGLLAKRLANSDEVDNLLADVRAHESERARRVAQAADAERTNAALIKADADRHDRERDRRRRFEALPPTDREAVTEKLRQYCKTGTDLREPWRGAPGEKLDALLDQFDAGGLERAEAARAT